MQNPIYSEAVSFLTYGSTILITMSENKKNVLFAEGFIKPELTIQQFEDFTPTNTLEKYPEFSFGLFKILPFANSDNFKWQFKIFNEYLMQNSQKRTKTREKLENY